MVLQRAVACVSSSLGALRLVSQGAQKHGAASGAAQNKRMAEDEKRHNLIDQVAKLERSMEAEIKRRMEADKALQVRTVFEQGGE